MGIVVVVTVGAVASVVMRMASRWMAVLPIATRIVHVVAGVPTITMARLLTCSVLVVHGVVAIAGSVNRIVPSIRRVGRRRERV